VSEELKAKDDEILELFKMCNEKDKQIERLNQYIGFYNDLTERQNKEIETLNNIIKEVREYIKQNEKEYGSLEDNEKIILEILDKGE